MGKLIVVFVCLITMGSRFVTAQTDLDRSRLSQAAYYNYSDQGDVTIKVHVWGAVRFPGYYEIARGTMMSELVSLSGGPLFGERAQRSKRTVDLKLHRSDGNTRTVIFRTKMENEIVVRDEDPILMDGDVLSYEAVFKQGFQWRDVFPIVSMVGTIVHIADRITSK